MIRLTRPPCPAVLEQNAPKWTSDYLSASPEKREERRKQYNKPTIRTALKEMCAGKCAYCESYILHVAYPHIEHYRPVSLFPEQTFEWENLLLACGKCNGAQHKGDRFPEEDEGGPLLNPCEDTPEDHLQFVYDATAGLASVYGKTPRGETTEKLLGLNRNELRKHRSLFFKKLLVIKRFSETSPEAAELLAQARQPSSEYSAFINSLL